MPDNVANPQAIEAPPVRQCGERAGAIRSVWLFAVLLLLIFVGMAAHPAFTTSATFDEPDQVAVGYASWHEARHAFANVNLRLSQMWAALPLLALDPKPVMPGVEESVAAAEVGINFGRLFFYKDGNQTEAIVAASRAMIILLGAALGALIFVYARRLHGDAAALLSLAFYCFSPLMISNSAVATSDVAAALLFTASILALWRMLHRISMSTILASGLLVGALAATKISGLLIVPMAALLVLFRLRNGRELRIDLPGRSPGQRPVKMAPLLGALFAAALVSWAVVWAIYGGPAGAPRSPLPQWETNFKESHFSTEMIQRLRVWRLLPEDYLHDLHRFVHSSSIRRAFFMGQYSVDGWWQFFPVAWLLKNPLGFQLALCAVLIALALRLTRRGQSSADHLGADWHGLTPLLVLAIVYGLFAVRGNLNIGARHLLPMLPPAFILAGLAARLVERPRSFRGIGLGLLIGVSALEAALVHPQHLAYFNLLAGGPKHGWRILSDSSAEWGEALPKVRAWMEKRRAAGESGRIYFSYFGSADLKHFGINEQTAVLLPQFYESRPVAAYPLGPGPYVLSTTMLNSLYDGPFFGPWRASYEQRYVELAAKMARFHQASQNRAALDALLAEEGRSAWTQYAADFDYLRFSRLCAYLRKREPDERITYGVVVYHLDINQLHEALAGPPPEMAPPDAIKGAAELEDEELDFLR